MVRNVASLTVSTPQGALIETLVFNNLQLRGAVVETERVSTEAFVTTEGYATVQQTRPNRSFEFEIVAFDNDALRNMEKIREAVEFGYRLTFRLLGGYLISNPAGATDNSTSTAIPCVLEFPDGIAWRAIRQGEGHESYSPLRIIARETATLSVPSQGNVIQVGGQGGIGN